MQLYCYNNHEFLDSWEKQHFPIFNKQRPCQSERALMRTRRLAWVFVVRLYNALVLYDIYSFCCYNAGKVHGYAGRSDTCGSYVGQCGFPRAICHFKVLFVSLLLALFLTKLLHL